MMNGQTKKLLSLLLSACVLLSILPSAVSAAGGTLEGDGTADSPYLIEDAADLAAFRDKVNAEASSKAYAKLTADIELVGDWTPFNPQSGYVTEAYAGTFDGDFHTVSGVNINSAKTDGIGFFGTVNNATVKNLQIVGNVSASNSSYVGGIIGKTQGTVTVDSCSFEGSVTSTKASGSANGTGGIVGRDNSGALTVKNCVNKAAVTGNGNLAAGILGSGASNAVTIENCYNTGAISGKWYASGICANNTKNTSAINNCYNIGAVQNSDNGEYLAGISANFRGNVTNSFYLYPETENKSAACTGTAAKISASSDLDSLIGAAFIKDSISINNGYPILSWQKAHAPVPKDPKISIAGSAVLYMENDSTVPQTTLSVQYTDMDAEPVTWTTDSDIITLEEPTDVDGNKSKIIVKAVKPGKATVTASTANGAYTAEQEIKVMPFITTVEIDGDVTVGETVRAKVNILGGGEYDYENYPELVFKWKYLTAEDYSNGNTGSSSYIDISDAVNREFEIPEELKGDYLSFEFYCSSECKTPSRPAKIHSARYKDLLSDCDSLTIATDDIKENTVIDLPSEGASGSLIIWESNYADIIDASGNVTLPGETTTEVTLKATLSLDGETTVKSFKINVFSVKAVEDEKKAEQHELNLKKLQEIKSALGDYYKITPVFGTDTNIVDILKADFSEKSVDLSEFNIALSEAETVYGGAEIAENGDITYFYADPNTTPAIKMGSFNASFTLSIDEAEATLTVPVIVYWDHDRVKEVMKSEILDNVTEASILGGNTAADHITEELVLPKVIDDKKWTQISWQSSDNNVVEISNENQSTADTLFNPYVGKIKRGAEDKTVTLTAIFTFSLTNDMTGGEAPVTMSKVFDVTVKAVGTEQIEAIKADLNAKLDAGFNAAGISDAATGSALALENGVYIAYNDISFPTVRDFNVDGKYYPVTISSGNDEVIKSPDVNNAARCEVCRPAVGKADADTVVTVILTDINSNVSVSRSFDITVPALTKAEVDAEKALMKRVKAAYFDGIKGENTDADNISGNLSPFFEVYEDNGELVWVRDSAGRTNRGIIAEPIEGWEELEAYRLFKSSNPASVTHENLLVKQQRNAKAVTINSVLSSERLGRYGELYKSDPVKYVDYAELAELYRQEVSADVVVRGTSTPSHVRPMAVEEKINVSFRLQSADSTLIQTVKYSDLKEGTTAFDIFKKALDESGYTYKKRGSYVYSVTTPDGTEIKELDEGENSGWLYKVNGEIPDVQMGAYGLQSGDDIVVFFTKDYTEETGYKHHGGSSSGKVKETASPLETEKSEETSKPEESANPDTTGSPEAEQNASYSDVAGHWAQTAIDFVTEKGLMYGTEDGKFEPDSPLTRAMLVTVLYRLENEPDVINDNMFTDIENGSYYENAVIWASGEGIIKGVSETEFAPEDNITREQIATIFYRYSQYKGYGVSAGEDTDIFSYTDAGEISEYAISAMRYAAGIGLMKGRTESTLNPQDNTTRAEIAVILTRTADIMK